MYGAADTIVSRDRDPVRLSDPIGTEGTVDIEMLALSLASTEPITVICDGAPTKWNVSLDLSETAAPKGTLAATKEHANGGTATSAIFVYLRLTFAYVDDANVVRVFDTAAEGSGPVQFDAVFPWAHALRPDDHELGTTFLAGVDPRPGAEKRHIRRTADPTTRHGTSTTCIQHFSRKGDQAHETCLMEADGM